MSRHCLSVSAVRGSKSHTLLISTRDRIIASRRAIFGNLKIVSQKGLAGRIHICIMVVSSRQEGQ